MSFLLLDSQGEVLETYDGSLRRVSHELATKHPDWDVTFDGDVATLLAEEDQEGRRENPVRLPVFEEGGTPSSRVPTSSGPTSILGPSDLLSSTTRATGIPRIDHDKVMRMTRDEAFARLRPWLPNGRNYDTWASAKRSVLATNYKTAKAAEGVRCWDPWAKREHVIPPSVSKGLSLMPSVYLTGGSLLKAGAQELMVQAQLMGHPMLQARGDVPAWQPFRMDKAQDKRFTLCSGATKECVASCLVLSGQQDSNITYRGKTYPIAANQIRKARLTEALLAEPEAFCKLLRDAIAFHRDQCLRDGQRCFVRLNVLSDLPWEVLYPELLQGWGREVIFYDYTKIAGRQPLSILQDGDLPYHLTFSYGGGQTHKRRAEYEMSMGTPVAIVFFIGQQNTFTRTSEGKKLPWSKSDFWRNLTFGGEKVYDGDCHDLRPLDPQEALVVGLQYKQPVRFERRKDVDVKSSAFLVQAESTDVPGLWVVPAVPRQLNAADFFEEDEDLA